MFSCGGTSAEQLSRLMKRLNVAKESLLGESKDELINTEFKDLKDAMESLQTQLSRTKCTEDSVTQQKLENVARLVDEMLASGRTKSGKEDDKITLFKYKLAAIKKLVDEENRKLQLYSEETIVELLLKRLDDAKLRLVVDESDHVRDEKSDVLPTDFDDVKDKMTYLQAVLSKAKAKEDEVVEKFQRIASWIKEISESGDAGNKPIKEKLTEISNEVGAAIKKIQEKEREKGEEEAKDLEAEAALEEVDNLLNLERQIQEGSAWSHLKLVVDSFETQLKKCLFTLTVFPPDAVIKKRLLFHWWMGEGILKPGHSGVEEGKKCFEQLISRGFIIPVKDKHCEKNHYCTIQTWIRRLLISVAKSNAFLEYEETTFPNVDYTRSHRACLRAQKPFVSDDEKADGELLTVYNVSKRYIDFTAEWLVNKIDLTTLQLGRWKDKVADDKKHQIEVKNSDLLEGLGNCRKLRYVSLRGVSRLEKLPEDFGKFKDLVVLDLRACHNLEKLPVSVGSAKRLEYLDISECYLLDQIPNKVAELRELRVFKGFVVGDPLNQKLCQVSDLVKLPNLRKLSINTGREFRLGELEKLHELKKLTSLTITWGLVKVEESSPGETAAPPKHDANQNLSDAGGTAPATLDKKSTTARVNPTTVVDENRDQPSHASTGLDETPKKAQENKKVSLIPPETSREPEKKSAFFELQKTFLKSAKPKKQPTTTTLTDVLPPEITKLDLRCFNEAQFPDWISPDKLKKLKKFYLRGGMLESLGEGTGWTVEVLRLRYLEHLDHDWEELKSSFPNLQYVEKVSCKRLESWPWPEKVDSWPWPQKEDSPWPDNKNRWGERTVRMGEENLHGHPVSPLI